MNSKEQKNTRGKKKGPAQTPRLVDNNHRTLFQHTYRAIFSMDPCLMQDPSCKDCHGTGSPGTLITKGGVRCPMVCACVVKSGWEASR